MDATTKKIIRAFKNNNVRINQLPREEKIKIIAELYDFIISDKYLSENIKSLIELMQELIQKGNGYIYELQESAINEIANYLQARIDKIEVDDAPQ